MIFFLEIVSIRGFFSSINRPHHLFYLVLEMLPNVFVWSRHLVLDIGVPRQVHELWIGTQGDLCLLNIDL